MKFRILIVIFSLFISSDVFAFKTKVCLGAEFAKWGVLYLHGLDTPESTKQEIENQKLLTALSAMLNFKLLIIRSEKLSPKGLLYWPQDSKTQVEQTLSEIIKLSKVCFNKQKNTMALGFSNGGYLLNKIFQYGLKNEFKEFLSFGAAGEVNSFSSNKGNTVKLKLYIGKQDKLTYKKTIEYFKKLTKMKLGVELKELNIGHELPGFEELKKILEDIFAN